MKLFFVFCILAPFSSFSQDSISFSPVCWTEYKYENLPYPESEHCPLILCLDNSVKCYLVEDNEMYTTMEGWRRISTTQIVIGEENWKFNVILETDSELHLQSVEYPDFKIYLKK